MTAGIIVVLIIVSYCGFCVACERQRERRVAETRRRADDQGWVQR
jgi:hypothetical protein